VSVLDPDEVPQALEEREEVVEAAGEHDLDRFGCERVRRAGRGDGRGRVRTVRSDLVEGDAGVNRELIVGMALLRLKTLAARTAGRACLNAVDWFWSICFCTAAVCCFSLVAVERFGEITAK
jgi:hypothetical protein